MVVMNHISLTLVRKGAHNFGTKCGNFNHTVIDLSVKLEKGGGLAVFESVLKLGKTDPVCWFVLFLIFFNGKTL